MPFLQLGINIAKSIEFDKTVYLVLDFKAGIGLFHPTLNHLDIPQREDATGLGKGKLGEVGGQPYWGPRSPVAEKWPDPSPVPFPKPGLTSGSWLQPGGFALASRTHGAHQLTEPISLALGGR